jgi:hypothetical protein
MEEQQILRMSSYQNELVWSSPVSGMEEQQILRMSSYLNELFWSSPVTGMEEQQIFRWSRMEESSSLSQTKFIPHTWHSICIKMINKSSQLRNRKAR